jgi:Transposase DDE domain group 1
MSLRMSARLPLQHKTPFQLDPKPLAEASSPRAGALAISRAFRSLGLPHLIAANLQLRKRQRGFTEGQMIESISLLQTIVGACPEDTRLLANDPCLERGLGYALPKTTAVREFLELFHDEKLEASRPKRQDQKSFIFPSSEPLAALQQVQAGCVRRIAKKYCEQGQALRIATIDQDATIIESHKQAALFHYEGGRGYQPMVAVWAEADLVLADEFRDGNVPAKQAPLKCAQLAFAALPESVTQRYFRGDSACHENQLIGWLKDPERARESGGTIGFGISAVMSQELAKALAKVEEKNWQTFGEEGDGTLRQWAEVDFVPGEAAEKKDSQPLRYVGLRLLKPQGVLFADGSDRHHHAVITNLKLEGARLLEWHREKAGTIEHVHDEVKNELGGKHVPSQRFGVNAAWFKLVLLTYNLVSAIKGMCFEPQERTARMKQFRILLVNLMGRMNRNNCVMSLRLCAPPPAIARMQKVWEVFALPTQATSSVATGRGGGLKMKKKKS